MIKQELIDFREKVNSIKAEKNVLNRQLDGNTKELEDIKEFGIAALEARAIIQSVAKATQSILESKFSTLVTLAIRTIFMDDRAFSIQFVERRNKTELDCFVIKNGNAVGIYDGGGGQISIIALACRLAFWNLEKKSRPLFFLDEPLAYLNSLEYQERASDLLQILSKELKIQMVVVSDQQNITADKTFRVTNGTVQVING